MSCPVKVVVVLALIVLNNQISSSHCLGVVNRNVASRTARISARALPPLWMSSRKDAVASQVLIRGSEEQQQLQTLKLKQKKQGVVEKATNSQLFSSVQDATMNDFIFMADNVVDDRSRQIFDTDSSSRTGSSNNISGMIDNVIVRPSQKVLDDMTGGWALSYANLLPETETTPLGITFLLTNVAYAMAGIALSIQGDVVLGTLTECASIASFIYHYTQLKFGGRDPSSSIVRLALLVDYIIASSSILLAVVYLVLGHQVPPMEAIVASGLALSFLGASWVWYDGLSYIFFHSLWHIFSAYAGYFVGNLHLGAATMTALS